MQSKDELKTLLSGLPPQTLDALSKIVSKDMAQAARAQLQDGNTYDIEPIIFMLEGKTIKGDGTTRAPTNCLTTKEFLGRLLKALGATRPAIMKAIKEAATEHINALLAAKVGATSEPKEADSTEQLLALAEGEMYLDNIIGQLPEIPVAGSVRHILEFRLMQPTKHAGSEPVKAQTDTKKSKKGAA